MVAMGIAEDRGEKTVPRLAGWAWSVPLSPLMFRRDWVAWKAQARVPVLRPVTRPLLAVHAQVAEAQGCGLPGLEQLGTTCPRPDQRTLAVHQERAGQNPLTALRRDVAAPQAVPWPSRP